MQVIVENPQVADAISRFNQMVDMEVNGSEGVDYEFLESMSFVLEMELQTILGDQQMVDEIIDHLYETA